MSTPDDTTPADIAKIRARFEDDRNNLLRKHQNELADLAARFQDDLARLTKRLHQHIIVGDGVTTEWRVDYDIYKLIGLTDRQGMNYPGTAYRYGDPSRIVIVKPPVPYGEEYTISYWMDDSDE